MSATSEQEDPLTECLLPRTVRCHVGIALCRQVDRFGIESDDRGSSVFIERTLQKNFFQSSGRHLSGDSPSRKLRAPPASKINDDPDIMGYMAKIIAFAGSIRVDSFNQKLVALGARKAEQAGAVVTLLNLADYPMPIFDQDLESRHGMPENARKFKQLLVSHDGFLIASPEYNSAYSPLLKNAIDWASRKESDTEIPLVAFKGKCAAIMSTSMGALGGLRGLVVLRMLLGNLGVTVLPNQIALPNAVSAFTEAGELVDDKRQTALCNLTGQLVALAKRIT